MANILFLGIAPVPDMPSIASRYPGRFFNNSPSDSENKKPYDQYAVGALKEQGHNVDYRDISTKAEMNKTCEELAGDKFDMVVLSNLHWQKSIRHEEQHFKIDEFLDALQKTGKPVVVYDSLEWRMMEDLRRRNIPYIHDNRLEHYKKLPQMVEQALMPKEQAKAL
jgi:hypothetical protein